MTNNYLTEGYRYFLTFVDLWNNYTYVEPLKTKKTLDVWAAIEKIIKDNQLDKCNSCGTDAGKEFLVILLALKKAPVSYTTFLTIFQGHEAKWSKFGIRHYVLNGPNKAFMAELYNKIIKSRLYRNLRSIYKNDWEKHIQSVVDGVNNTANLGIGGLRPAATNSPIYDDLVRAKRGGNGHHRISLPAFKEQKLKVDDYVFPDFPGPIFSKGFDPARGMTYQIASIDERNSPTLYTVKQLNGTMVKKKFYSFQLFPAPDPYSHEWPIEKVLSKKHVGKGKNRHEEYLVKFLDYDDSYNEWVPKDQVINAL